MKKLLLLVSVLLTFSTVQAQTIEKELDSIQESVDLIRSLLDQASIPVTDIEAEFISKNIMEIRFQNNTDESLDIEYYAPGIHTEWQHSIARYTAPIPANATNARIGVGTQADWLVRVTQGEWASEPIVVSQWSKPQSLMIGLWDSWESTDTFDLWKDYSNRIDTAKENLIVQIGNFQNGYSDEEIRSRISSRIVDGDVLFYLLDDEPFLGSGSLSAEYWNRINSIADEFGIPFGWSLSDNKVNNFDFYSEYEMIIPINTYLFFQENYGGKGVWGNMRIETENQFRQEADRVFNNARKKLPNSKFIFVAQGFSDKNKYRKPPVESVEWTHDYVKENPDIIGVLWYEYSDRTGTGLKSMPDIYNAIKGEENFISIDCGFWYSQEVPDIELKNLCTIGQSRSANMNLMQPVVDSDLKVVPSIGGFDSGDSEAMLRKRVGWYTQNFKNIGHENIAFVILQDEPNHLTTKELEIIADEAQKEFGDIESTYTYTRGALLRGQFHRNATLIGLNFYPFFRKDAPEGYVQIDSYEDFKNHADDVLSKPRKEIPGVTFAITAQTFYTREGAGGNPWRKPPIESAEWYMRYIKESGDIKYLLFWEWQNSEKWIGLESMNALQSAWNLQLNNKK